MSVIKVQAPIALAGSGHAPKHCWQHIFAASQHRIVLDTTCCGRSFGLQSVKTVNGFRTTKKKYEQGVILCIFLEKIGTDEQLISIVMFFIC